MRLRCSGNVLFCIDLLAAPLLAVVMVSPDPSLSVSSRAFCSAVWLLALASTSINYFNNTPLLWIFLNIRGIYLDTTHGHGLIPAMYE